MIVFKPRLAAFYVVLFVTIALLSNHVTVKPQNSSGEMKATTIVDAAH